MLLDIVFVSLVSSFSTFIWILSLVLIPILIYDEMLKYTLVLSALVLALICVYNYTLSNLAFIVYISFSVITIIGIMLAHNEQIAPKYNYSKHSSK